MGYNHQPVMFQPISGMGKNCDDFTEACRDMIVMVVDVAQLRHDNPPDADPSK